MIILYEALSGSRAYGLELPDSDTDTRYVFLNDDLATVIGLDKHENQDSKSEGEDRVGFELRRFLQLLRKTNTTVVEMLFSSGKGEVNPEFRKWILSAPHRFLDTKFMFKSLMGYVYGERKLVNGERKGNEGAKRRLALEKYGYSPKNAVQCFRLCHCGERFFSKGYFPVNIREDDVDLWRFLMHIKTRPQDLTADKVIAWIEGAENRLKAAFDTRDINKDYHFDNDYANEVVLRLYHPLLEQFHRNLVG